MDDARHELLINKQQTNLCTHFLIYVLSVSQL